MTIRNLAAPEVAALLKEGKIVLIDVREAAEFAGEHIEGARHVPLSTFDPKALPVDGGRSVVFQCRSGVRSARAVEACRKAGLSHDAHLEGGILAWINAGLPTVSGS